MEISQRIQQELFFPQVMLVVVYKKDWGSKKMGAENQGKKLMEQFKQTNSQNLGTGV